MERVGVAEVVEVAEVLADGAMLSADVLVSANIRSRSCLAFSMRAKARSMLVKSSSLRPLLFESGAVCGRLFGEVGLFRRLARKRSSAAPRFGPSVPSSSLSFCSLVCCFSVLKGSGMGELSVSAMFSIVAAGSVNTSSTLTAGRMDCDAALDSRGLLDSLFASVEGCSGSVGREEERKTLAVTVDG